MTQRDRYVVGVLGVVAVLAGFWFLALKPKREEAKELATQITQQEERRDAALAKVREGEAARASFAEDYEAVARLGKAVPVSDQVPSLLYQLNSAAGNTGVDFRSMKLRTDGMSASPAPAASSSPSSGDAKPQVPTATQAAAAVAPPGSAVGPAGFPTMPFTFNFEGDFFRMERMLSAIERFTGTTGTDDDVRVSGRLLTVDAFALAKSNLREWPYVQAGIAATAYVLPPEEGAFGGATPAGPSTGAGAPGTTAGSPAAKPASGSTPTTAAVGGIGQ